MQQPTTAASTYKKVENMEGPLGVEVVRYHPSQIKIEKQPGKKTAAYFCGGVKRSPRKIRADNGIGGGSGSEKAARPAAGASETSSANVSSIAEDSDLSDNLSVVSDLSDLSVITFSHSYLSNNPSFRQPHNSLHNRRHSRHPVPQLAGVHGCHAQMTQSSTSNSFQNSRQQLRMLSSSNQRISVDAFGKPQQLSSLSSARRAELSKLKEDNFGLRRENVNLRGQLESLQMQQKQLILQNLHGPVEQSQSSSTSPDILLSGQQNITASSDSRVQLRAAHDEIFRLKTEDARMRLEVKARTVEVEAQRAKISKLSEDCVEIKQRNKELEASFSSCEESLSQLNSAKVNLASQLDTANSDLVRAVESRDWYTQQLQSTQGKRNDVQSEVVSLQKNVSARNVAVAELQAAVESSKIALENEKQKYKIEKDEFSVKLRRIEAEMSDQETQLDQIQREKDEMISDLTGRLAELEGEAGEIGSLSDGYKMIQEELERLKETVQCKEEELARVRSSVDTLESQKRALEQGVTDVKESAREKDTKIGRLEQDLVSRNKIIEGFKDSLTTKEENYNMLLSERESLDQSMELLLVEMNQYKKDNTAKSKQCQDHEKRVEQLEQELMEQHQTLDDAEARAVKFKASLAEKEGSLAEKEACLAEKEAQITEMESKFTSGTKEKEDVVTRCETAESDRDNMRRQLEARLTPSPEPEVSELKDELISLKQKILNLEQYENELADLRQEYDDLQEVKSRVADKLMESEKVYDEEVEKLRELVIQRDGLIESLKQDLDSFQSDLEKTKLLLDENSADRDREVTEKSRKLEDLSEALKDYDSTQKMLLEKQASLEEAGEQGQSLRDENEAMADQIHNLRGKLQTIEAENVRLKHAVSDQMETDDECREIQSQRIARLEGFVHEYESEVKELADSNTQLQNQIILLEEANGKQQSECLLNESLREQIMQLQRDLHKDTSLRQELARSIELAKLNLGDEITVLEERLREERDKHSTTKEAAMRLEQENLDAQKEMNGLLIRQGEATEEIRRLEMALKRKDSFSISPVRDVESSHRVKELEHVLEEKKRSVCSLEDHISTLKFHLEQKSTELEDARKLLVLNTDKNEGILEQMRRSQESLRVELAQQVQSAELLAEERSSYRGQVLEMNSALKNSLAHIKDLRSKASDYPVVLQHSVVDVDPLAELMLRRSAPTTSTGIATSSGRNISSLQNCLASVKAEMMILQSKLAPRTDSRASLSPDYWRGDAAAAPSVGDDADKTKSEFVEIDGASSSN